MAHYRAIIKGSEKPFAASNLMSRISQNGDLISIAVALELVHEPNR
jgi:hypothetical protein